MENKKQKENEEVQKRIEKIKALLKDWKLVDILEIDCNEQMYEKFKYTLYKFNRENNINLHISTAIGYLLCIEVLNYERGKGEITEEQLQEYRKQLEK